jgi:hypothetical protein
MKKKYLKISIWRNLKDPSFISTTLFLLTDNVSGFTFEFNPGESRLYFKNSNPFSYARLYLTDAKFFHLMREDKSKKTTIKVEREGSLFEYSIITL